MKTKSKILALSVLVGVFFISRQYMDFASRSSKLSPAKEDADLSAKSQKMTDKTKAVPASTSVSKSAQSLLENCRRILSLTGGDRKQQIDAFLAGLESEADWLAVQKCISEAAEAGNEFSYAWTAYWKQLSTKNCALAVAWLNDLPVNHRWYCEAAEEVVEAWAGKAPTEAQQWLDKNQAIPDEYVTLIVKKLIRGYANYDPVQAATYASKIFQPNEIDFRNVTFDISKAVFVRNGEEGLRAWFDAIPTEFRRQYFGSVGNRLGSKDTALQRKWLEDQVASPFRDNKAYDNYIKTSAETDPKSALEFALSIPPHVSDGTSVSVGTAVESWLRRGSMGLQDYLKAMPESSSKEAISRELAEQSKTGKSFAIRRAAEQAASALVVPR